MAHQGIPAAPDPDQDVVALLIAQHGEIRTLFDEVERSEGDQRRDAFRRLVRLLAVHETAEEEIVHPYLRRAVDGGADIVEDRLREERQAKEALRRLEDIGTDDPAFPGRLLALRKAVTEHARAEERYEFTLVRRTADAGRLATMAKSLKAAEATAPTHPHPGVESATANVLAGPFAAVADRTRDAIRRTIGKDR
ncbi:hemerythrin domain-containing protein [Streptantibioticus cattleyicolor]|uniref:Hemerythrin HHE cation binding domain-containing protein n=1 Tax=Streptantibioticus cattleyicolor (strain ATCC 35852 / DSM 46488 / JCM 4925 / NBRC 14057 / NRRL 8057) TaxID=1003195 RepID=F8JLG6_STREN|nr:hemerythrin domain-containing protein [Streptantibioticus cattleyicolor]AEW98320.1 hemerythrin HHE cation binding domain-containing protein [Streptantibioticus cattleyicolor NRRL 8057 = DSM 46488]CCB72622.1 conserved protein of unknown function [Streptantibioticus cattleyicolor NRRL 8057 = DSM 46488]